MKKSILTLIIALFSAYGFGQTETDTTKIYRIETSDGNEYIGKIIKLETYVTWLKTENIGIIKIFHRDIVNQVEVRKEQIIDGFLWYENLQATRYFWAPNGYGLKEGEAYYQNMWILYNQAGYGFSDNFSVGAGLLPLFLFGGSPTPMWITPKFSIPLKKDKINLGLGLLAATVVGTSDASFGIAYGVSTFGSRDRNLTFGMGYGYAGGNWAKRPIIMLGGMARTGKKGYLMTENYIITSENETFVLSMIGGRTLIKKIALDYGLIIPFSAEMEQFVAIPWLGITIPIRSK